MADPKAINITEDEAALYDRQIRLWGLDAQRRLRAARALLVGVSGLGAEVAKNIVLSGIKSLTLLDHVEVSTEDACSQFLVNRSDLGKNRAESSLERTQLLNPMVEVSADTDNVADKSEDFFKNFDVICVTCCTTQAMVKINEICHENKIMFFAGDIFGYYGYMFADLNEHEYAEEVQKKRKIEENDDDGEPATKKNKTDELETVVEKKCCSFTRMKNALNVDWNSEKAQRSLKRTPNTYFIMQVLLQFRNKYQRDPDRKHLEEDRKNLLELRSTVLSELGVKQNLVEDGFSLHCFAELSPVCAIVGGVLGQEIIKAVSQKDQPHNNFFFYNGVDGNGMVDKFGY